MTTFAEIQTACRVRDRAWMGNTSPSLSYRGNELAGEVGEFCNIIKKLDREVMGVVGSRATVKQAAEELADVIICAVNLANDLGLWLDHAVPHKFNLTSEKYDLPVRMKED